ncbi:MAG: hypothetical protein IJY61_01305 [Candidatus Gastranaerophilales bacterium]|nr:hypothetical protein [Candidatus Gastranaerophilales bacterium]
MDCMQINGLTGIYDGTIKNSSVRYGRNAVNNHQNYLKTFDITSSKLPKIKSTKLLGLSDDKFSITTQKMNATLKTLDKALEQPLDYELRYQPETKKGTVDTMALMGAAYEQLGQKASISVRKATAILKKSFAEFKKSVSANALDINKDRKIDLSEYASYMLASDMLSTEPTSSDLKRANITGTITNQGENASYALFNKGIEEDARTIFKSIQSDFNLNEAQKEFTSEPNNLV